MATGAVRDLLKRSSLLVNVVRWVRTNYNVVRDAVRKNYEILRGSVRTNYYIVDELAAFSPNSGGSLRARADLTVQSARLAC